MATTSLRSKAPEISESPSILHPDSVGSELAPQHWQDPVVEGEIGLRDLTVPWLSQAQKTGELGENFPHGSLVLNKELVLSEFPKRDALNGPPLNGVQILKFQVSFEEDIPWEEKKIRQPLSWKTERALVDAGYTTNWPQGEEKPDNLAIRIGKLILLIPAPAALSEDEKLMHFPYRYDSQRYALAACILRKTSWTASGKIISDIANNPGFAGKGGLSGVKWQVFGKKLIKYNSYAIQFKRLGFFDTPMLEFGRSLQQR